MISNDIQRTYYSEALEDDERRKKRSHYEIATTANSTDIFLENRNTEPENLTEEKINYWMEYKSIESTSHRGGWKENWPKETKQPREKLKDYKEEQFDTSIAVDTPSQFKGKEYYLQQLQETLPFRPAIHARAQRISRIHFLRSILEDLDQIRQYTSNPLAAVYVKILLNRIRAMRALLTFDPFLEVLMAFHDSLAVENKWFEYSAEQYEKAYNLLKRLGQKRSIKNEMIEKAIMELEDIGFDTTPFEL